MDAGVPPSPTGTLLLHVADNDLYSADTMMGPPLANASVAFYPPGGGAVIEGTSAADGTLTFSGIDWSLGKGTVVAYAANRGAIILTDINPDTLMKLPKSGTYPDGLVFGLATYASKAAAQTTISGKVTKSDAAHYATIGTTTGSSFFQDTSATYSLTVPSGKPFTLLATEWQRETAPAIQSFFKWVKIDVPVNTATVDVDFATATALTSKKVKRTFNLPGGASGALGGTSAYVIVTLPQTDAVLGYATSQLAASDGASVAVEAEVIPDFPGSVITYNTLQKTDGSVSYLIEDGAPPDGSTVDGFAAPPAFTFDSVRLGDPLTLTGLVDGEAENAYYVAGNGDIMMVLASIEGANGAATITLTPPRTATLPMALRTQLGTQALTGYFLGTLRDDQLPISKLPKHYLYSRTFNAAF